MPKKNEFELDEVMEEQSDASSRRAEAGEAPEEGRKKKASRPKMEDTADLNEFATGGFKIPEEALGELSPREQRRREKKEKKQKKGGLFGRRKVPDFDEGEDMYYGIQLKPIDEYRKGYDPATGEVSLSQAAYQDLFDDSKKAIDDEVEQNFERLRKERRRRVAEAVQTAGVDEEQVADEFGIVAPMPVTAFSADPYAKQHGIEMEGAQPSEDVPDIQKAMMSSVGDQNMEVKLNVLNDTMEIQRVREMPTVSEESVNKILESADREKNTPEEEAPRGENKAAEPEAENVPAEKKEAPEGAPPEGQSGVSTGRPIEDAPKVANVYEYRTRGISTHVIDADLLQSALLSETDELRHAGDSEEKRAAHRRVRNQKLSEHEEEPEEYGIDPTEDIDDYTGPEDMKSISNELRGDMRELTLRMMITGVCTVLLAGVNLIFGVQFSGAGDLGSLPILYIALTVIFVGVAIGVCYRTVFNGLRALFTFNANSDSAAAVAAVAVAAQTIVSVFFSSELRDGKLHLYAVVLSAALFINAAGKLTMIRRIHSNFRFVTSREQKYTVRTYDDYNTSLKMTKDCVAEKPLIAYQCKAGFLKRFLELSYEPDPSERSSQTLAPIGLISSLVLCIVCLLITRSVPTAISALAAASCACIAVSNMLCVNLPVSRLCRTARRAGAMVVGYKAVEQLGGVNAVLVDAEEIFPRGTVVLGGIKTFGNRAGAEEAIMAASAVMREVGGPLVSVFDQVISENEDSLPQVEGFSYEEEGGIVGRVDGKTIYVGTRALLVNHQIEAPTREEESQYAAGNKTIVYLALDDKVSAMLVLSYSADRRRKNELQRLEHSGISVVIRTTDPNVTPALVSRLFGIDVNSVGVLEGELADLAQKLRGAEIPRADAVVATKGRMESMMNVVADCVEEKRTAGVVVAIQTAAVIMGFVLVAFMACFGGMRQLSAFILFAFQLFWFLVVLVIPRLRK